MNAWAALSPLTKQIVVAVAVLVVFVIVYLLGRRHDR